VVVVEKEKKQLRIFFLSHHD